MKTSWGGNVNNIMWATWMCLCQTLVCMSKTTQFQQYLKCVSDSGESQWTFNAVGEFASERNHRVLSVPCLSNVLWPHGPSECQRLHVWVHFVAELAKMAAVVSLKLSQLISQARDCILHLLSVTALGPDSHSLLSVGFISSTRRTMNENYGPSCT